MKFCTQCGKEIKDNSRFCIYCGKEVKSEEKKAVNKLEQTTKQDIAEPYPTEIRTNGAMVIIMLIAIGVAIWQICNLADTAARDARWDYLALSGFGYGIDVTGSYVTYTILLIVSGFFALGAAASIKEKVYVAKCPYCEETIYYPIKSKNLKCERCNKIMIFKDNKIQKIPEETKNQNS